MFNIKLFEDFEWYYEISFDHFIKYIENPIIYNFNKKDIEIICKFLGPKLATNNSHQILLGQNATYGFTNAEISVLDGKFMLYDGCDLDVKFENCSNITIIGDEMQNYSIDSFVDNDLVTKLPNFTLEINNFTKRYETIFINKAYDDWFIIEGTANKYYKCDRIDGLLKFLERGNFRTL